MASRMAWVFAARGRPGRLAVGFIALGAVVGATALVLGGYKAGLMVVRAVTLTTTAATWLFNSALLANPIGLVVVGLVALGVGLVVAWRKFETFRNVVRGTWSWIRNNWPLLLAIITGPFGLATLAIRRNFGTIKRGALAVIDFIVRQWQRLPKPVRDFAGGNLPSLPGSVGGIPTGPTLPELVGRIPFLAEGGVARSPGLSLVGERGPEILTLPRAARVDPLPAPAMSTAGARETIVHTHVHLDGREVARSVSRHVAYEQARR